MATEERRNMAPGDNKEPQGKDRLRRMDAEGIGFVPINEGSAACRWMECVVSMLIDTMETKNRSCQRRRRCRQDRSVNDEEEEDQHGGNECWKKTDLAVMRINEEEETATLSAKKCVNKRRRRRPRPQTSHNNNWPIECVPGI